jgi:hypothetical protein
MEHFLHQNILFVLAIYCNMLDSCLASILDLVLLQYDQVICICTGCPSDP